MRPEHPAVEAIAGDGRKKKNWRKAIWVQDAAQCLAAGNGTIDGRGVLERDVDKRHAGADDLDRPLRKQFTEPKPQGARHFLPLFDHLAKLDGRVRHPQHDLSPAAIDAHRYGADTFLERERGGIGTDQALIQQHPARPYGRMAGKWQLDMRGEDPDLRGMLSLLRWQHKGRLRQVRLPRNRLHLGGGEPIAL